MTALMYLLGARALDRANERRQRPATVPEPGLLPIASTTETAAAWRRWAEAGRTPAARAARPTSVAAREPSTHGGAV